MRNTCGTASSTAQRLRGVRECGARGESAHKATTWAVNVTLATAANGKSFGSIHGNLSLSTNVAWPILITLLIAFYAYTVNNLPSVCSLRHETF